VGIASSIEAALEAIDPAADPYLDAAYRRRQSLRHLGVRQAVVVGERQALALRTLDLVHAIANRLARRRPLEQSEGVGSVVRRLRHSTDFGKRPFDSLASLTDSASGSSPSGRLTANDALL